MPDQYEIDRAIAQLRIVRYLISKADSRQRTHGEKHHFHVVALSELQEALTALGDHASWLRFDDDSPINAQPATSIKDLQKNDIPF